MNPTTARKLAEAALRGQAAADEEMASIVRVARRRGEPAHDLLAAHKRWADEQRSAARGGCSIEHAYRCGYAATAGDFGPTDTADWPH